MNVSASGSRDRFIISVQFVYSCLPCLVSFERNIFIAGTRSQWDLQHCDKTITQTNVGIIYSCACDSWRALIHVNNSGRFPRIYLRLFDKLLITKTHFMKQRFFSVPWREECSRQRFVGQIATINLCYWKCHFSPTTTKARLLFFSKKNTVKKENKHKPKGNKKKS